MTTPPLDVRDALLRAVEVFPGVHLRQLAREVGISEQLANYHLNSLAEEKLVRSEQDGVYRRFFPAGRGAYSEKDQRTMGLLRQRVPFQIALLLLDRGRATQKELAKELELVKSTISYHAHRLLKEGYLSEDRDGILTLANPEQVRRLVGAWRPPSTFLDRFESFWRRFYRPRL